MNVVHVALMWLLPAEGCGEELSPLRLESTSPARLRHGLGGGKHPKTHPLVMSRRTANSRHVKWRVENDPAVEL